MFVITPEKWEKNETLNKIQISINAENFTSTWREKHITAEQKSENVSVMFQ